jgi:hypothetical protein
VATEPYLVTGRVPEPSEDYRRRAEFTTEARDNSVGPRPLTGLHHVFDACYADRGSIAQSSKTETSAQRGKTTTLTHHDDGHVRRRDSPATAPSISAFRSARRSPTMKKDVALPAYGDCP